ncbi:DUF559 domain-containing protein [Sporomusa aerivorans]|uniref:DUF559 domain-containing protein n=1 Tax=Sporomusa aerivorans TaxID=204936 RepID=UPI00352AFD8C
MIDLNSPIEKIMREALVKSNIKFREQEAIYRKGNPVPIYIIDFVVSGEYCKIAIECDGKYHMEAERKRLDAQRDYFLIQQNHYYDDILRFTGSEIKKNVTSCIKAIITSITKYDALKKTQIEKLHIDVSSMRNKAIDYNQRSEIINIILREVLIVLTNDRSNNEKTILREVKKAIRKNFISVNEQKVYFVYPSIESDLLKSEIDFFITAYNSIYLIKFCDNGRKTRISSQLLKDSNITKVFINLNNDVSGVVFSKEETKNWVLINGVANSIIESDFIVDTSIINVPQALELFSNKTKCTHKKNVLLKGNEGRDTTIESNFTANSSDVLKVDQYDSMRLHDMTIEELRIFVLEIGNTGRDVQLLKTFFFHKDYEIRRRACSAAAKIGNPEVTKDIVSCLYAPEPQVRQYALKAILKSQCKELFPHISLVLKTEMKDYNIKLCKQIIREEHSWKG